jgi:hypothetical protein
VQRLHFGEINALATADLNGDGRAEIVASLPGAGTVQLVTVNANGLLAPGTVVWETTFPAALATADLDGDNVPDLVAVDTLTRRVFVALGDGAGGWRSRNVWAIDIEPAGLLVRRGPEGPELVITGGDRRSLVLVDPRTGLSRVTATTRDSHLAFAAADLDGDGVDELLHDSAVLRDTDGYALLSSGSPVGPPTGSMLRVDMDGDGREELVVEEPVRGEIVVYTANGADLIEQRRRAAPKHLMGLRALAGEEGGHDVVWWSAAGYGILAGVDLIPVFSVTQDSIVEVVPLHLDEDTRQDVAVLRQTSSSASEVRLAMRMGDQLVLQEPVYEGGRTTGVAVARLDSDARDDLWVADDAGVTALRSGDGWTPIVAAAVANLAGALAIDLDGDGMLDLVGCDPNGPRGVLATPGTGDGTLGTAVRISDATCTGIRGCDVDGDGQLELVLERVNINENTSTANYANLEILTHASGEWASGGSLYPGLEVLQLAPRCTPDGLSSWTGGSRGLARIDVITGPALVEQGSPPTSSKVLVGDIDADGLDELILDDDPRVMVAYADGAGGFRPTISRARAASPAGSKIVGLGEFDGEPGAELVVAELDVNGRRRHALWAIRGEHLVRIDELATATWEVLGDFDGDGRDELLSRDNDWPALVRPGIPPLLLDREPFDGLVALRAADMDGDGRSDLLASRAPPSPYASSDIYLLRSVASGFTAPRALKLTARLELLGVGDLDHEDGLELVHVTPLVGLTVCRGGDAGPAAHCAATPWTAAPSLLWPAVVDDLDGDGYPDVVLSGNTRDSIILQILRGDGTGRLDPTHSQALADGELHRARLGGEEPRWVLLANDRASLLTLEQTP